MRKIKYLVAFLALCLPILSEATVCRKLDCNPLAAPSVCQKHRWTFLARMGPSFATHAFGLVNVSDDLGNRGSRLLKRHTGNMYNIKAGYGVSKYFTLGIETSYDTHLIIARRFELNGGVAVFNTSGKAQAITFMPMCEIHVVAVKRLSTYLTFGLGANFNSIIQKRENISKFTLSNTLAIKAGTGFDYFLSNFIAINCELGWLYNHGRLHVAGTTELGRPVTGTGHFSMSNVSFLMGLRYLY